MEEVNFADAMPNLRPRKKLENVDLPGLLLQNEKLKNLNGRKMYRRPKQVSSMPVSPLRLKKNIKPKQPSIVRRNMRNISSNGPIQAFPLPSDQEKQNAEICSKIMKSHSFKFPNPNIVIETTTSIEHSRNNTPLAKERTSDNLAEQLLLPGSTYAANKAGGSQKQSESPSPTSTTKKPSLRKSSDTTSKTKSPPRSKQDSAKRYSPHLKLKKAKGHGNTPSPEKSPVHKRVNFHRNRVLRSTAMSVTNRLSILKK